MKNFLLPAAVVCLLISTCVIIYKAVAYADDSAAIKETNAEAKINIEISDLQVKGKKNYDLVMKRFAQNLADTKASDTMGWEWGQRRKKEREETRRHEDLIQALEENTAARNK